MSEVVSGRKGMAAVQTSIPRSKLAKRNSILRIQDPAKIFAVEPAQNPIAG
jgi:hypothetical protein